jgi:hypothetical protein
MFGEFQQYEGYAVLSANLTYIGKYGSKIERV